RLRRLPGRARARDAARRAVAVRAPGPERLPLLTDCARWVAGRILGRFESGDHVGHLLVPFDGAAGEWAGQRGFQAVKGLDPDHRVLAFTTHPALGAVTTDPTYGTDVQYNLHVGDITYTLMFSSAFLGGLQAYAVYKTQAGRLSRIGQGRTNEVGTTTGGRVF